MVRPPLALVPPPAPGTDEADARLLVRLDDGDLAALGELYDRHASAIRRFAVRFLGDAATAEDLVHDVFVALPGAASRYRREGSLRSFLVAMAANLSKNHVRAAARRRELAARAGREPLAPSRGADDDFDRAELSAMLQQALDALSHEHRVAFVLCEVEERPGTEVADMLAIPEATVRTRVFYAKKRLRELLAAPR